MTDAEKRLWSRLRSGGLDGVRFRRQAPIGRYFADFVCYERKLIIEVDGGQHALDVERDKARTRWLESQGFHVVRFWNNDVLANTDGVLMEIQRVLQHLPPP